MAQPVQTDPTAVFGRRVLAAVIDLLIVMVPSLAIFSSQFEYIELGDSGRSGSEYCDAFLDQADGLCFNLNDTVYFSDGGAGIERFAGLLLGIGIFVVLQGLTGWTPGKLATGIRTVQADGRACGMGKAFIRWILWIVDGQPCGIPLVGFITGLTTVGHRRVGDMAAKTYVVRASAMGLPVAVPGLTAPPPPPGAYASAGAWGSTGSAPPPPSATGWSTSPAPTSTAAEPSGGQAAPPPQWDEARGTYIQWDPNQSAWLQWDEGAKAWARIPGQ